MIDETITRYDVVIILCDLLHQQGCRDSSVSIETGYGLGDPGIESRWGGARFSAPVQTCPGAHPASCRTGTESFPGSKAAGAWC